MTVKEIIAGIKDKPGELSRIVSRLYENDINVVGFWVGFENKKATIRFIASDPEAAMSVLAGLDVEAKTTDVFAVRVPDHTGGLNSVLKTLGSANINIAHTYSCLGTALPILILEVDKPKDAVRAFKENWIELLDEKVYKL